MFVDSVQVAELYGKAAWLIILVRSHESMVAIKRGGQELDVESAQRTEENASGGRKLIRLPARGVALEW